MAELAKQEVLAWLPKLTEQNLVEICGGLLPVVLTVKEGKLGKNQSMRNVIRRYLCSEDVEELEDEGLSIFEKLKGDMESMMLEDMENDTKKKLEELKISFSSINLYKDLKGRSREPGRQELF